MALKLLGMEQGSRYGAMKMEHCLISIRFQGVKGLALKIKKNDNAPNLRGVLIAGYHNRHPLFLLCIEETKG